MRGAQTETPPAGGVLRGAGGAQLPVATRRACMYFCAQ